MALSKHEHETNVLGKISWDKNIPIKINPERIIEVCRIAYSKSISIEVIQHLLGGLTWNIIQSWKFKTRLIAFTIAKIFCWKMSQKRKKKLCGLKTAIVHPQTY